MSSANMDHLDQSKCHKHAATLLRNIKKAHKAGHDRRADDLTRVYLTSFDARYAAVLDVCHGMKREKRPAKGKLAEIAKNLDAWRGTSEEVQVFFREKKGLNKDYRPVMAFGIQHRALQRLLLNLLRVRANLHANQFAIRGGVAATIQRLIAEIKVGNIHSAEGDISSCYSSFNHEVIHKFVPLPKEVINHCIVSTHFNLVPGNFTNILGKDAWSKASSSSFGVFDQYISAARSGLPQGSATSPLISEMLLASIVAGLNQKGLALSYADNILVMGKDDNDVAEQCETLRCALASHPAGPLTPRFEVHHAHMPFVALGYRIHSLANGSIKVEPSNENLGKFAEKFHRMSKLIQNSGISKARRRRRLLELAMYTKCWVGAFSVWPERHSFRAKQLAKIAHLKFVLEQEGSG